MFAEIKYDGERVQVHKNGEKFNYFSRSLKEVQPHKVLNIKIRNYKRKFLNVKIFLEIQNFCSRNKRALESIDSSD